MQNSNMTLYKSCLECGMCKRKYHSSSSSSTTSEKRNYTARLKHQKQLYALRMQGYNSQQLSYQKLLLMDETRRLQRTIYLKDLSKAFKKPLRGLIEPHSKSHRHEIPSCWQSCSQGRP